MGRFTVHIRDKRLWEIRGGTGVRGNAFEDNELKNTAELLELFAEIGSRAEFLSALQRLNGFYAVIRENDDGVYAAVDRIRSIPLFYGTRNSYFYISDDAHWIRDQVGDKNFEEIAETEFLLTGLVTGPDTLYRNVKQLQAGEAITVEYGSEGNRISTHRYYRYIHSYHMDAAEEEFLERHDEVVLNIFRRLIRLANGRPIAVPLSGGYDSRLIALMLKRL
jgi:asparagine synthase (glutamine-hydrolysing)